MKPRPCKQCLTQLFLLSSFKMVSDKLFFCIHSTNTTINANMAARFFVLIANIAAMTSHVLTSCRLEMSSNKTSYTENNAKTMATFFCGFIVWLLHQKEKFDFIKRVDKGWITTVKDLESWRFERYPFVRANRGIVGCCGLYESVEELCHWWRYGHMNLWTN